MENNLRWNFESTRCAFNKRASGLQVLPSPLQWFLPGPQNVYGGGAARRLGLARGLFFHRESTWNPPHASGRILIFDIKPLNSKACWLSGIPFRNH